MTFNKFTNSFVFIFSCWLSVQKGTIWSFVVPVLLIALVGNIRFASETISYSLSNKLLAQVHLTKCTVLKDDIGDSQL